MISLTDFPHRRDFHKSRLQTLIWAHRDRAHRFPHSMDCKPTSSSGKSRDRSPRISNQCIRGINDLEHWFPARLTRSNTDFRSPRIVNTDFKINDFQIIAISNTDFVGPFWFKFTLFVAYWFPAPRFQPDLGSYVISVTHDLNHWFCNQWFPHKQWIATRFR